MTPGTKFATSKYLATIKERNQNNDLSPPLLYRSSKISAGKSLTSLPEQWSPAVAAPTC